MAKSKPQQTLKTAISCTGVGVHTGAMVTMTFRPAAPNTGIVFRRTDLSPAEGGGADIPAVAGSVIDTQLGTTISADGAFKGKATVSTIEHVMAALAGCGIDNLVIDVDAGEAPVMDGSSAPFVRLIECAGIEQQAAPRRYLRILRKVEVVDGQKVASLEPFDGQSFFFSIDFDTPVIGQQELEVELAAGAFKSDIADARTFGFVKDVEFLRSLGLARGSSLENSVAIQDDAILNEEGLRHDDEFVRHKMLDAIGDLFVLGAPVIGRYRGVRSGHAFNYQLVQALLAEPDAFEITTEAPATALPAVTGGAVSGASAPVGQAVAAPA
ncbi:UDP-3-O-acyl-N-acetylglucosamine deacetylase [Pyruvatibacter mobilis]|uniref:UDP-3-O-acyl-N-acetylglucosamine deacetylase n=1 Tax=Pyruvatibacter mobilis TaxID=1712261 RepID=UPI003BB1BA52